MMAILTLKAVLLAFTVPRFAFGEKMSLEEHVSRASDRGHRRWVARAGLYLLAVCGRLLTVMHRSVRRSGLSVVNGSAPARLHVACRNFGSESEAMACGNGRGPYSAQTWLSAVTVSAQFSPASVCYI